MCVFVFMCLCVCVRVCDCEIGGCGNRDITPLRSPELDWWKAGSQGYGGIVTSHGVCLSQRGERGERKTERREKDR